MGIRRLIKENYNLKKNVTYNLVTDGYMRPLITIIKTIKSVFDNYITNVYDDILA